MPYPRTRSTDGTAKDFFTNAKVAHRKALDAMPYIRRGKKEQSASLCIRRDGKGRRRSVGEG